MPCISIEDVANYAILKAEASSMKIVKGLFFSAICDCYFGTLYLDRDPYYPARNHMITRSVQGRILCINCSLGLSVKLMPDGFRRRLQSWLRRNLLTIIPPIGEEIYYGGPRRAPH